MLTATSEQLERLINAAESLEHYAREWADELIDLDEGKSVKEYTRHVAQIEIEIHAFNAIRLEIEGKQIAIGSV